jgi:hypothetical protein
LAISSRGITSSFRRQAGYITILIAFGLKTVKTGRKGQK